MSISFLRAAASGGGRLWVTVDKVDLLKPAQALADVAGPALPDALDRGELGIGGGEDRIEVPEAVDDALRHQAGQPRNALERAVSARAHRELEGARLAVVAEQLGEAAKVEHLLVRERCELFENLLNAPLTVLRRVVADQRDALRHDADGRLLELHLDQSPLRAQLDDVALHLGGH